MSNREALADIREAFSRIYGSAPEAIGRAPGRLEVLGNHTDYNDGLVISCAIDRNTWFAASTIPGKTCRITLAADGQEAVFDIDDLATPIRGEWSNYVKGVIVELQKRGHGISAFQAVISSNVPLSAGMSSSAALEMSVCMALGALNQIDLPNADWARIGQACENNYVGANTGLLDQFTSLMGKENQLVFIDFRTMDVTNIACPDGAVFVVANSGVKHDLTTDYNERRERCEEAASTMASKHPGVTHLRDVASNQLEAARSDMPVLTYRRALHITGENERVMAGLSALQANDLPAFGELLSQSHMSSRENFENSCDELDILIEVAKSLPGCYGSRLSGGGFGGISIHLVDADKAELFSQRLATAFKTRTGVTPDTMISAIGQGASLYV